MPTAHLQPMNGMPGSKLQTAKMPGHWLLARLGKRVLRPGGRAMTEAFLRDLGLNAGDDVVEFAPGLGLTARKVLEAGPHSYTGVERDAEAAAWCAGHLPEGANIHVRVGSADQTGLADGSASVVVGEAMLSMNSPVQKQRIMDEAYRILRPGGRYAIHELLIVPDDLPAVIKEDMESALSAAIHVGARPLTRREWCDHLKQSGFEIIQVSTAPMNLLQPARLVADEGVWRTIRFMKNVLTDHDARRRVLTMRRTFQKYRSHLRAVSVIARK